MQEKRKTIEEKISHTGHVKTSQDNLKCYELAYEIFTGARKLEKLTKESVQKPWPDRPNYFSQINVEAIVRGLNIKEDGMSLMVNYPAQATNDDISRD